MLPLVADQASCVVNLALGNRAFGLAIASCRRHRDPFEFLPTKISIENCMAKAFKSSNMLSEKLRLIWRSRIPPDDGRFGKKGIEQSRRQLKRSRSDNIFTPVVPAASVI